MKLGNPLKGVVVHDGVLRAKMLSKKIRVGAVDVLMFQGVAGVETNLRLNGPELPPCLLDMWGWVPWTTDGKV